MSSHAVDYVRRPVGSSHCMRANTETAEHTKKQMYPSRSQIKQPSISDQATPNGDKALTRGNDSNLEFRACPCSLTELSSVP